MGVTLPPEILTIICELCASPPGLCNTRSCGDYSISFCCVKKACMALRLVSREWNAVSTPFVFDHIKLRLFPSSVGKFNRLCDSELAKHVRTLDFHPDLLPVWEKETWLSNVLHSEPVVEGRVKHRLTEDLEAYDEATRQSLSTEELDAGWAAYEKHMSGQRRWHNNLPDLQTMLEHALLRLPNLCRTTVACCASSYQLRRNLFSAFAQEPFLQILAREIIVPAKTWLVSLTPELSNRKHVELEDACSLAYVEAIGHRSQHPGAKQVKTFTFDLKSQQTLSMLSAASKHAAGVSGGHISRPKALLQACTETTDLTLRFREAVAHQKDDDGQAEDLRQILRAAKDVRTLHLEFGNFFTDQLHFSRHGSVEPQIALMTILSNPSITCHHLKELSLSAVLPGQALAEFLKVHSPTLKRLGLRRSTSDDGKIVLHIIAKHLNLDRLHLFWLVDGYHNYSDEQSWTLRKFEDDTSHFHFEQCFHWDGTPEDSKFLRLLDCIHFREAMRKFFRGKGSLGLPTEFYTEMEDMRQGAYNRSTTTAAAIQGDI